MSNESSVHVVRGRLSWAKVIGQPRLNKFTGEREWSVDVEIDEDGMKLFKKLGILDRLRDPKGDDNRNRFVTFKQREFKKDGTPNEPIKIVSATGEPWGTDLIGNGSVGDVKFQFRDYGVGKRAGIYIRAIRVLDLVKYESQEFAPLDSDDEFFATADTSDFNKDFGLEDPNADLDDDIPE